MIASNTRQRKSVSERTASSAENSTSSVYSRASCTDFTAASSTCSSLMRSLSFMWMGLVAMKVWMRLRAAGATASPARRMSFSLARASEQTVDSFTASATARIASKSPWLAAANPASITSTRSRSSCLPIRTFSSRVMEAPGLCSPSRMVVSKMINWSCMVHSGKGDGTLAGPFAGRRRNCRIVGVGYLAREAQQQAGEARQREAKQVVGDGRDAVHANRL